MLHLVEDLDRVMAKYRASYQIDTKSTTSEARKRKEQRKWKEEKRKRGSSQLSKTEEKEDALFSVPWEKSSLQRTLSRTYLAFPNWKQLIVKPYICLPQRQTRHACARPLHCKLLRLGRPGDCLGLPHLWMNELTTVL